MLVLQILKREIMHLKRPEGLNIVPFIDIMLVLLAIVLTISTFIAQGKIKVDLPPSTSSVQQKENTNSLEITIDSSNKLFIKEKEVDIALLKEEILKTDNKDEIVVFGDLKSDFGRFIEVVDILKEKGHENFQIVTKHEKK
jgi:biopolymer transport protein ExbD